MGFPFDLCCCSLGVALGDPRGSREVPLQPESSLVRYARGGNLFFILFSVHLKRTRCSSCLFSPPISHQIINPPLPISPFFFPLPSLFLTTEAPPPSLSFFLSFFSTYYRFSLFSPRNIWYSSPFTPFVSTSRESYKPHITPSGSQLQLLSPCRQTITMTTRYDYSLMELLTDVC